MSTTEQEQTPADTQALTHAQRAEELKATLDQIITDLDPSYGEIEDDDIELFITILESSLAELNELSQEFD
jgi:hypothetical protein